MKRLARSVRLTLLAAAACGPASGGPAPTAPMSDATAKVDAPTPAPVNASPQATCSPGPASPLIVRLEAEDRVDIAAALKRGIVVVSYNCRELKLAKSCHVDGRYDFVGRARKDLSLQLMSREEAEPLMPSLGKPLPPLQPGDNDSFDLKVSTVGRMLTTVASAGAKDLQGSCAGATHFVRAVSVGAFELTTEHSSGSRKRSTSTTDGSLDACASAASSSRPPAQCQAPIQLELTPLVR